MNVAVKMSNFRYNAYNRLQKEVGKTSLSLSRLSRISVTCKPLVKITRDVAMRYEPLKRKDWSILLFFFVHSLILIPEF